MLAHEIPRVIHKSKRRCDEVVDPPCKLTMGLFAGLPIVQVHQAKALVRVINPPSYLDQFLRIHPKNIERERPLA
jgi:hypothetical protein